MPKTEEKDMALPDAPAQASPAESFDLVLDEFCVRLSKVDRRVELLAAFHAAEKAAGRLKDTEANFSARFAAFQTQPA